MPTYNYQCQTCNHEFEAYSKIKDRDIPIFDACPECNNHTIIRVPVLSSGFRLKGDLQPLSGDYKNLLSNIKRKNTTVSHKSTINDNGL